MHVFNSGVEKAKRPPDFFEVNDLI